MAGETVEERLETTADKAFSKPTPAEVKAKENEQKAIDASIAEARAAAQACLNSELFKDYAEKFQGMEKWLIVRFRQIDPMSPSALIEFVKVQTEMEVLGALMGSVKLDAGSKNS
jgi:hypothetical protein